MNRYETQRGQVLPLVAICIVVLLGFAGLAVDVGFHRYETRIQQSATDSAALAGAWELNQGHMLSSAQYDAAKNGFADNTSNGSCTICVTAHNPPLTGAYTGDNTAVEVDISAVRPTFFERVFSIPSVTIHTRAVARKVATNNGCAYMLDPNANTNFNKGTVLAASCSLYANGSVNTNGATVTDSQFGIGNMSGSNTTGISPAPTHITTMVVDPCFQIDGCAYLQANAPSTSPCTGGGNITGGATSGTAVWISPGCYGNTTFNDPTVGQGKNKQTVPGYINMNPGLYVINGAWSLGDVNLSGTGVTFYITSSGSLNVDSNPNLNLSPPTSGNTTGVLFYEVPSNTTGPNFNKVTNVVLSGLLYFPGASCLNMNKSSASYTIVVAGCVNWNKGTETFNGPTSGSSLIKDAILAE